MMDTLEGVGYFIRSINNPSISYCVTIFNPGHSKFNFSSITQNPRVELKSQDLLLVGAKPFRAKQNMKYECSHFSTFLPLVYTVVFDNLWHLVISLWVLLSLAYKLLLSIAYQYIQHTVEKCIIFQVLYKYSEQVMLIRPFNTCFTLHLADFTQPQPRIIL